MRQTHASITPRSPRRAAARPPGLPDRFAARLHAWRIDRDLAAGEVPWSTTAHAARALHLATDRRRRALAGSLEGLVERSQRPPSLLRSTPVEPCREQVRDALPTIMEIASRLRDGAPLNPRGLAALRVLLADGCGPCYTASRLDALTVAAEQVREWLDVDG